LAFAHIQDGKNFTETAKMVRVRPRALMTWVANFRRMGLEGLKDTYGGGRRPYVSTEKHEEFKRAVLNLQQERCGGRIRGKDVADLMEKMCGSRPSKSSVYETLKRVGLVWITGRSQHPKADKEAQNALKKTSKKK